MHGGANSSLRRPCALTIGIDARAAAEVPAGRGRVVRELLRALDAPAGRRRALRPLRPRALGRAARTSRFTWRLIAAARPAVAPARRGAPRAASDVFLSTNSYLTAWFLRPPSVAFVYDLVPFVEGARGPAPRAARIERATIRPALRRAAALLCISRGDAQRDLVAALPAHAAAKAFVVAAGRRRALLRGAGRRGSRGPRRHGARPPVRARRGDARAAQEPAARCSRPTRGLPEGVRAAHGSSSSAPRAGTWTRRCALPSARAGDVQLLGPRRATTTSPRSTGPARSSPTRRCTRASACRCSRRWPPGAAVLTSTCSSLPEVGGDAAPLVDPPTTSDIRDRLQELTRRLPSPSARDAARAWS